MVTSALKKIFSTEEIRAIASFLTVGSVTAAVYFLLFLFLLNIISLEYHIAITIAYVVSIIFYFFANRHFTFKNKQKAIKQQLAKFMVLVCLNYSITVVVIHNMVEIFKLTPVVGAVIAIATTTILSYTISKWWVFRQAEPMIENQEKI